MDTITLRLVSLFFLLELVSTSNLAQINIKYQEIKSVKNCAPRDTCFPNKISDWNKEYSNNDGNNGDWNDTSARNWNIRNCFCDAECNVYGDCCVDSPNFKLKEVEDNSSENENFQCIQGSNNYHYIKTDCPLGWKNGMIRKSCEEGDSAEDPISSLPITNVNSGITFKNYYCALCNNQSNLDEMEIWKAQLSCGSYPDGVANFTSALSENDYEYEKGNQSSAFTILSGGREIGSACGIHATVPDKAENIIRLCSPAIRNCPAEYNNTDIHRKCLSYTSLVYSKFSFPSYRNVHCAICNGLKTDEVTCIPSLTPFREYHEKAAFSFLFDLNPSTGNMVGRIEKCSPEEIYDPFTKKCRIILCSTGRLYKEGKCVDVIGSPSSNTTNSTHDFEICPKISLDRSEYDILDNLTISYLAYDKNISNEFYKFTEDGHVIVCAIETKNYIEKFGALLGYLSTIGVAVSVVCLIIHLIVFMIVPDLKNLSGKCLASLCVALLVVYSVFLGLPFVEVQSVSCKTLAVILYYSFLAAFCWMLVLSWDVSMTLRKATKELRVSTGPQWKRFILYFSFGWGFPIILTVIAAVTDINNSEELSDIYSPNFGKHNCWFGQRMALLIYFIVPIGFIMTINAILFVATAKILSSAEKGTANAKSCGPNHQNFKLYLRLAVLMGVSWIMGIIAGYVDISFLWIVFIILNTLQGLFIFIAFTCTVKIRKALKIKLESSSLFSDLFSSASKIDDKNTNTTRATISNEGEQHEISEFRN